MAVHGLQWQQQIFIMHGPAILDIVVWCDIIYDAHSTLVVVLGTFMRATYSQTVVQPVKIPFLDHIGDALFWQANAHVTQRSLQAVHHLP